MQLTSAASTTKGTTGYVYDADGNLLLQEDPSSSTLYLPGEQLTAAGTTIAGARIIPLPSGGDVVRTGVTTSYYFEVPDIRGTSTVYLDNTAQTPTWRQFTPYGAPRGTTVTWIDNRGYLGKPADTVTGLTSLGARQYDPVTSQFISPDPLLVPSDPQDLNPYAYASDNPETFSDPSGKDPIAAAIVTYLATHPSKANNAALAAVYAPPPQYQIPQPAKPAIRTVTRAPAAPDARTQPAPTYDPSTCGHLGVGCEGFNRATAIPRSSSFNPLHWIAHTAAPAVWKGVDTAYDWVVKNPWSAAGWAEVALGVLSLTPIGWGVDVTFGVGLVLSVASAARECTTGQTAGCALDATSILVGGLGYGASRVAGNLRGMADNASLVKGWLLRGAAQVSVAYSYFAGGFSVLTSGLSNAPCRALQSQGC